MKKLTKKEKQKKQKKIFIKQIKNYINEIK